MSFVADNVDWLVEAPVVTSFTRVGYVVRKTFDSWRSLDSYDLTGRVVAITGPTSGLGLAATRRFAHAGATVAMVARDGEKAEAVRHELVSETGNGDVTITVADMGVTQQVRAAADDLLARHDRLDVLVHNAGALFNDRRVSAEGAELTTAVHVVAPFLLTGLLFDRLCETPAARVLTMSSGGMYAAGLAAEDLEMSEGSYRGTEQYARAKRAQVTLNEMWAARTRGRGVRFHAVHPGWADTPGVEAALPGFRRLVGPLLRSPDQGADTLVWLGADDGLPLDTNGRFWLDRRVRPIHKLGRTRRTDTPERRERLWTRVSESAGWDLPGV